MSEPREAVLEIARAYLGPRLAGGSLHVVLDDGNVEDIHVQTCLDFAKQEGDTEGIQLAEALLTLSEADRWWVYNDGEDVPRDEDDCDLWVDVDALQTEIDRRGKLIEEQEKEVNRLRAENASMDQQLTDLAQGLSLTAQEVLRLREQRTRDEEILPWLQGEIDNLRTELASLRKEREAHWAQQSRIAERGGHGPGSDF